MSEFEDSTIIDQIHNLEATEFEQFVAALWELQGWTTERTPRSDDGGRDIIAERTIPFSLSLKIEVKGWYDDPITPSKVRQYSLLPGDDTDLAVMDSTSGLSSNGSLRQSPETPYQLSISPESVRSAQKDSPRPVSSL